MATTSQSDHRSADALHGQETATAARTPEASPVKRVEERQRSFRLQVKAPYRTGE